MKSWIRNHPVATFLAILYPLVWLFNLPALLGTIGLGIIHAEIPWQPGVLASTLLALAGTAFLVTAIADGKQGVKDLLRRFYALRVGPQWYVLAICLAPALLLVVALARNGAAALTPWATHASLLLTVYLQTVITGAILISLCEEAGWTAFVTARLQRRWGALRACLAVGPLQGFVHVPLLFMAGTVAVGGGRLHIQDAPLIVFVLLIGYAIPIRIILTWIYNSTGGSLPIVALTHQAFDQMGSAVILTTFFAGINATWVDVVPAPCALAIVLLTRGNLGYRAERAVVPAQRIPAPAAV